MSLKKYNNFFGTFSVIFSLYSLIARLYQNLTYAGWLAYIKFKSYLYHFLHVNIILHCSGSKSLLWDQVIIRHHCGSPSVLRGGTDDSPGQRGLPSSR